VTATGRGCVKTPKFFLAAKKFTTWTEKVWGTKFNHATEHFRKRNFRMNIPTKNSIFEFLYSLGRLLPNGARPRAGW
jgi:hypothetical protein